MALAIIWLVLFVIWVVVEFIGGWRSGQQGGTLANHAGDVLLVILVGILGWVVLVAALAR